MEYTKVRRYVFLLPLHILGGICLPNFYTRRWMEKVHIHVFQNIINILMLLFVCFTFLNVILGAIKDVFGFLPRFQELSMAGIFVCQVVSMKMRWKQILEVFDHQEKLFKVSNTKVANEYIAREQLELKVLFAIFLLNLVSFLTVPLVAGFDKSVQDNVNEHKYPHRFLPLIVPTLMPRSFDPSELHNFIIIYVVELLAACCVIVSYYSLNTLGILVVTPLEGQYKMLAKFVQLIGANHCDAEGSAIFYTDVANGEYEYISEVMMKSR